VTNPSREAKNAYVIQKSISGEISELGNEFTGIVAAQAPAF
jgi:hypothetical protein